MKRKQQTLEPPQPKRRSKPKEEREEQDFFAELMLANDAHWFEAEGRRIGAVWMQLVSRDEAQEWLDRVDETHQRKRQDSKVKVYANEIDGGHYRSGVPVIVFDHHGRLVNGQHILGGFLKSSAEMIITTVQINLDDKAYQAIDENKKRSASDTLKWNGIEHPGDVARVSMVLYQYLKGYYAGKGYLSARSADKLPTNAEIEATQKRFPEIAGHLHRDPGAGGYSLPALRAASVILIQVDEKYHKKFFRALIDGVGIDDPKEPVAVLRAALQKAHLTANDRGGWRHGETMLRVFKAWNCGIRGEAISGPLYRKGELFLQDPMGAFPVPESTRNSRSRVQ